MAARSSQARPGPALTQVALDAVLAEHVPALGDDHVLLPLVAHIAVDHGAQGGVLGLHDPGGARVGWAWNACGEVGCMGTGCRRHRMSAQRASSSGQGLPGTRSVPGGTPHLELAVGCRRRGLLLAQALQTVLGILRQEGRKGQHASKGALPAAIQPSRHRLAQFGEGGWKEAPPAAAPRGAAPWSSPSAPAPPRHRARLPGAPAAAAWPARPTAGGAAGRTEAGGEPGPSYQKAAHARHPAGPKIVRRRSPAGFQAGRHGAPAPPPALARGRAARRPRPQPAPPRSALRPAPCPARAAAPAAGQGFRAGFKRTCEEPSSLGHLGNSPMGGCPSHGGSLGMRTLVQQALGKRELVCFSACPRQSMRHPTTSFSTDVLPPAQPKQQATGIPHPHAVPTHLHSRLQLCHALLRQ